ncbi:hypothetical protein BpHYR1_008844 [Brachionus plicatilis]|uniref:Uncharacterized protein n=1 Tax=Brachionus plicatilis TaxID=10195 RepID=A0A3M7T592_BRAPC|nr:hypothetical protein BpHYR1_008844 [Brachionus plicatilis]
MMQCSAVIFDCLIVSIGVLILGISDDNERCTTLLQFVECVDFLDHEFASFYQGFYLGWICHVAVRIKSFSQTILEIIITKWVVFTII